MTASGTLAFAVLGLPAGAWVDRFRRRPILVASDVARALLLATIPVAGLLGVLTITHLVVVSLLAGCARVFFDVGYQSYLPAVLGKDRLLTGNSALETIRASGQVAGPGLGGWLVALALNNIAFAVASAVGFLFLIRVLGLSPTAIGLVIATGSVAAMLGAAVTPWLSRRFGSARIVWLSLAVTGPLAMGGPFAQPGWLISLYVASIAIGEFGQIVYAVTSVTVRQRLVPDTVLGRVNATMRFLMMGLFPLGALIGGVLGQFAGLRITLFVAGGLIVVSGLPLYRTLRSTPSVDDIPALT